jgi:hypothetical protein
MTFRADGSRLCERHLYEKFAWLNRLAWSLLKQHPGRQTSAVKGRSSGRSDVFLMQASR